MKFNFLLYFFVVGFTASVSSEVTLPYDCEINTRAVSTLTVPMIAEIPYNSPVATGSFSLWGINGTSRTLTIISDNQNMAVGEQQKAIDTLKGVLRVVAMHTFSLDGLGSSTVYSSAAYPNADIFFGTEVPPPFSTDTTFFSVPSMCGWINCALIATQKFYSAINYSQASKLAFNLNYNSPLNTQRVYISPKNEYQKHTLVFMDTVGTMGFGISAPVTYTKWKYLGNTYLPPNGGNSSFQITCISVPTPLALTLGASSIDFGTVMLGSATSVTRELTWSATGSGQAGTWQLTFNPSATDASGKYISLGGADVSVLDPDNNLVALNTPVNVSGVSGNYILSLDPTKGTTGAKATLLNVILTAN